VRSGDGSASWKAPVKPRARTVPRIGAMMTPPNDRTNCWVAFTTPMMRYGKAFWTATFSNGRSVPMPIPITIMLRTTTGQVVPTPIRLNSAIPATMNSAPITASTL
jgi:hypothetical protein